LKYGAIILGGLTIAGIIYYLWNRKDPPKWVFINKNQHLYKSHQKKYLKNKWIINFRDQTKKLTKNFYKI